MLYTDKNYACSYIWDLYLGVGHCLAALSRYILKSKQQKQQRVPVGYMCQKYFASDIPAMSTHCYILYLQVLYCVNTLSFLQLNVGG